MGVAQVSKEDLDLQNHLIGLQQIYIKLSFLTSGDLLKVTIQTYFLGSIVILFASTSYRQFLPQASRRLKILHFTCFTNFQ